MSISSKYARIIGKNWGQYLMQFDALEISAAAVDPRHLKVEVAE